jgi:hypothetical protein
MNHTWLATCCRPQLHNQLAAAAQRQFQQVWAWQLLQWLWQHQDI